MIVLLQPIFTYGSKELLPTNTIWIEVDETKTVLAIKMNIDVPKEPKPKKAKERKVLHIRREVLFTAYTHYFSHVRAMSLGREDMIARARDDARTRFSFS